MNSKLLEERFSLSGQVAVLTGGGGVIAKTMATALLEAGAQVSLWGRTHSSLSKNRDEIIAENPEFSTNIFLAELDCGDKNALEQAYKNLETTLATPSILINGVGGNKGKASFVEQDISLFREVLEKNLLAGMVLPTQVFAQKWIEKKIAASIINLSSMSAYNGLSGVWAYNAAKAGLMNLTVGTAREFAQYNIRVNSISPGFFIGKQNHDLLIRQDEPLILTERGKQVLNKTPQGRFGNFEDMKGATIFLASNRASGFITGIDLPVDGGYLTDNI